ncbi:glycosyltransferase [Bradyrhizobium sp. ISRA443]|uniref:CgeB family protein n=1 Tax=unclassified Bradyrhizobium TaxID=2631580 RepID=UPI002479F143|nr:MULTISPECIES: glycosyltransferase [unclassified Bradyrhizobium]WGR97416.1 glycosyltransferase [Bradyrhizobium sp. ISRA436]WGS04304.1 glycosyltransferase [Bradyrhizobium sp. ISRA437]WGS11188.1 glycosyltransferase [Bradyrhizobium sp. ISRA443]
MRILILNADYPRFLAWLYRREPTLSEASYADQMSARNTTLFGVADFYSRNFAELGHAAAEIHVNNSYLQSAWAHEHGMAVEARAEIASSKAQRLPGWLQRAAVPFKPLLRPLARRVGLSPRLDKQGERILLAQIEDFQPDLILNQDAFHVDTRLIRRIKAVCNPVIVGQVGIEPSSGEDWAAYDLLISQLPTTVEWFRRRGVRAEVNHLAFDPVVLERLPAAAEAPVDVSFVGTVSDDHRQRIMLLEAVAQRYDLKLWGTLPRTLPASSPLHACLQGEVWGADMYQVLRRSKITLNSHIDLAGREAGNMRLFEATGVGTFLLTDFKDNLHTLFEPDREVAVWRTVEDCLKTVERYLDDAGGRTAIAKAGHAKTLGEHTYRHRTREILGYVETLKPRK